MKLPVAAFKLIVAGQQNVKFWDFVMENPDLNVCHIETSLLGGYLVSLELLREPDEEADNRLEVIARIKQLTEEFPQFLPQASPVVGGGPGGGMRRM
jgi:hypothetical protein